MRFAAIFVSCAPLAVFCTPPVSGAEPSAIQRQIEFVAHATDGVLGVSATHIETGRTVSVRGKEGFPMASAFKVPVAVQLMTMVEAGQLTLDRMVTVGPHDLHPGSGRISDLMFHPGLSMSVENLMEMMLVISDNSAADLMLREAGGPEAVTARMRALGLPGIRVDRPTALLISDWVGAKNIPPESEWNREMWDRMYDAVPNAQHMQARRAEMKDPRDTATPDDMTRLLVHIWRKDLFSRANAEVLLGMMERCQTGKARIKGMLPAGTDVAHKTGTLGGVANDVGVITLPDGLGHVAISIFTKASNKPEDAQEKAVAEVSRTIYDYFVLFPSSDGADGAKN
ncbi:MAG: class A beta-lactamase [Acidobacteriota bacterium]|nr:class A beta-lactamase [Acidobacteriota bacterium]